MTFGQDKLKQEIEKQIGNFKPDNLIEFIKMLHCDIDTEQFYNSDEFVRNQVAFGVTKQDAAQQFGVDERTVFNMISQLDPDRRSSDTEPYYIAGQPINIKIKEKRIDNKKLKQLDESVKADRRVRFCSESSVHPVFLQLNVTQLGILLRALATDYDNNPSEITLGLGAYLYSQLSDYAKERLLKVFANMYDNVSDFLDELEELEEEDIKKAFTDEYELAHENNESIDENLLIMYVKNCWKCDIKIQMSNENKFFRNVTLLYDNGYIVLTESGEKLKVNCSSFIEICKR